MKIGVSGYFGYGNLGDEIFLRTWKQVFHDHDVVSLSSYHDIESIDRVIIGGGDLIIPSNFTNAYWRDVFLQKPTFVYGVGVPAHGTDYLNAKYVEDPEVMELYSNFLGQVRHISVRDKSSQTWLRNKLGIESDLVPDIAWAYKVSGVPFKKLSQPTVGISIRKNKVFKWQHVVELSKHIMMNGYDILLIPVQIAPNDQWGDYSLHQKLQKELLAFDINTVNIIPPNSDIDQQIRFIELCDIYVTQRMHGMLMGIRMGTPTIPMCVGIKFYEVLKTLRLKNLAVNIDLYNMKTKFDLVSSKLLNLDRTKIIRKQEQDSMLCLEKFKGRVLLG